MREGKTFLHQHAVIASENRHFLDDEWCTALQHSELECATLHYTAPQHAMLCYAMPPLSSLTVSMTHPLALMSTAMASIAVLSVSTPISLSNVIVVITYIGGAISLILTGASATLLLSPSRRASLIASMPSYVKHVTSMSALILTG